jgi:DNA-binding Lrp family transcriptional regulator
MEMTEQALEYIKAHKEGVLQSELWKILNIDSRKCSRIVSKLQSDKLITRELEIADGIRTYRLRIVSRSSDACRFRPLLADEIFVPCAGCIDECIPEHCAKLSEWIFIVVLGEGTTLDQDLKKVVAAKLSSGP